MYYVLRLFYLSRKDKENYIKAPIKKTNEIEKTCFSQKEHVIDYNNLNGKGSICF